MHTNKFKQGKWIYVLIPILAIFAATVVLLGKSPPLTALASNNRNIAENASKSYTENGQLKLVRTLFTSEWGVPYPAGLSYSYEHGQLALLTKNEMTQPVNNSSAIVVITPFEEPVGTAELAFIADPAINIAFDDASGHLLLYNNQQAELARVVVGENGVPYPNSVTFFDMHHLNISHAAGMDVDLTNRHLFILDSDTSEIVTVDIDNGYSLVSKIDLTFLTTELQGIAVHPDSHNLFVVSPVDEILYELSASGKLLYSYDLAALALTDPRGLAFGPSTDLTDAPNTMNLFIADSNLVGKGNIPETEQLFGKVLEVELDPVVRFAVIGDFGTNSADTAGVAALVDNWDPDFVITTGDNNYPDGEAATIDENIGQHYSQFIGNYQGSYGLGSPTNRFWPTLGNHDWHTITCTGNNCTGAHFDYFTLPNNERYYEVDLGLVYLFALDSDSGEPDGRNSESIQANWLQNQLAASTACYNMVFFHHPPYSSGFHGSNEALQWPFAAWGADALFGGHDHMYERLEVNGLPYFVNGAGGKTLYDFENIDNLEPEATSVVRYNEDHGAMLVTATSTEITYQFYNEAGTLIDEYTVAQDCAGDPTSTPTPTPTSQATPPSPTPVANTLTFNPSADAYVGEIAPDTNFGTAAKLEIDKSPDEESYLRFSVSGVTGPVQQATLRLFASNSSWNGPSLYGTESSWSETEITWNNRPAVTTGMLADVEAMQSGTWVEVDVTATVNENGVYDFVLLPDSLDGATFSAREGNAPAELVLTFGSVMTATPTNTPTSTPTASPSPTPTATNTPTASPPPTILTFGSSADAFVRETEPDRNFGLSSRLDIDKSPNEESFVRFFVSGVTGNIQSATLRLFVNNGSSNGPGVFGTDNNWTETEIAWNNRPLPTTGLIADVDAIQSGGWIEYDVTAVVDGDGFYNFVFLPDSTNGVAFSSRESTLSPELVLSFDAETTATPTPSPTPGLTFLTIVTSADAFVRETDPARNFGISTRLDSDESPREESYVRFDVNDVSGNVQNAILRLFVNNGSSNGPAVYGTGNNWSETALTWGNRPLPTTGLIADVDAIQSGGWIEYEVTAVVDGEGTYNFVILPESTNGVAFSSREGSNPSELILTLLSQ